MRHAKAARVQDRIRERTQRRGTALRRLETSREKSYKVVAISLYSDQADAVDRTAQELLDIGYRRASRSLVIQAAIERLREELSGKDRIELLRYFSEREARRPLARMTSRMRTREKSQPEQLILPNMTILR